MGSCEKWDSETNDEINDKQLCAPRVTLQYGKNILQDNCNLSIQDKWSLIYTLLRTKIDTSHIWYI